MLNKTGKEADKEGKGDKIHPLHENEGVEIRDEGVR